MLWDGGQWWGLSMDTSDIALVLSYPKGKGSPVGWGGGGESVRCCFDAPGDVGHFKTDQSDIKE